jgi:predicted flavoprotein YhiN
MYIIGEVNDIDGASGGFNLHYAWGSGIVAARDIIRKIKESE